MKTFQTFRTFGGGGGAVSIAGTLPSGHSIGTLTINGTPTVLNETVTTIVPSVATGHAIAVYNNEAGTAVTLNETLTTLGVPTWNATTDILSISYTGEDGTVQTQTVNIPITSTAVVVTPTVLSGNQIANISVNGSIVALYETITTITGALASGNAIGTYTNEAGTAVTLNETVTTVNPSVATGHAIAVYTNETGSPVTINETATTLGVPTWTSATNTLTINYTGETGTVQSQSVVIPASGSTVSIAGTLASGNAIGTLTINGTPTTLNETVTTISGVLTGQHTIGTYTNEAGTAVVLQETATTLGTPTWTSATNTLTINYTGETGTVQSQSVVIPAGGSTVSIAGTLSSGNAIGTLTINGTPTTLNETTTTLTGVLTGQHTIGTYTNEAGTAVVLQETTTTLGVPTWTSATNTLTINYTGETGTVQSQSVVIPSSGGGSTVSIAGTLASGHSIGTLTINGTPTTINETTTTLTGVLTGQHTIGTYTNEAGSAVVLQETVTTITGALTSGTAIGTYTNEAGTAVNLFAPSATTVTLTGTVATGHSIGTLTVNGTPTTLNETTTTLTGVLTGQHTIGTYTNEAGTAVVLQETNTTLNAATWNGTTHVLTLSYTGENGTVQTQNVTLSSSAAQVVYVNATSPNTATIFSLSNPPTVNDPTLVHLTDAIYVGTDGSEWTWNGTTYTTYTSTAAINQTTQITATAGQTAFTLTSVPKGAVYMYRNGVRINNTAYSNVGAAVTYVPANNGGATLGALVAGDIIIFDWLS